MEVSELWHISASESVLKISQSSADSAEIIVQSCYSLISAGTEKIVSLGQIPEQIAEQMKVPYMKGDYPFPVSYGYSLVGKVIKGPENLINNFVHVMYPHHNFALVEADDIFPVPDSIPPKRAVFASNLETVINAIWDSKMQLGDSILVAGFGTIGALLSLTLLQFPGIDVKVKENNKARRDYAKACGLELHDKNNSPTQFDICFHCTGSTEGLQFCIDNAKTEGKIIELSWYGNKSVNIQLGGSFHSGRKSIISSQVSSIPAYKNSSWDFRKRKELVFKLLENDIYDKLPCLEIPFAGAPVLFNRMRKEFINEPGLIIQY